MRAAQHNLRKIEVLVAIFFQKYTFFVKIFGVPPICPITNFSASAPQPHCPINPKSGGGGPLSHYWDKPNNDHM